MSSAVSVLTGLLKKSNQDQIVIFGGYAAFTAFLAFFPFVIFLMAVAGLIGSVKEAETVISYGLDYFPPKVMEAVAPVLRSVLENESPGLLTFGGIATLWIASSGVEGLRFGLNKVYAISDFRPLWKRRLQSMVVVVVGALAFLLLLLMVIGWPLVVQLLGDLLFFSLENRAWLTLIRMVMAALVLFLLFASLYRVLPNYPLSWRQVRPGALLAALLWLALAQLFSVYLAHFGRYDVTYGSIGGIIITLIFFHYSATVILLGAELNRQLSEQ